MPWSVHRVVTGAAVVASIVVLAAGASGLASPMAQSDGRRPTTFFVSLTGNDANAGTLDAPWRSLRSAIAKLRPGDTLYIRGGDYTTGGDTIDSQMGTVPSGTSWANAITVAGYKSEPVRLRPPSGLSAIRLTTGAPHYLVFQDFAIDMSLQSDPANPRVADAPEAIYVAYGAHHIRFRRLDIGHTMSNAINWSTNNSPVPFSSFLELLDSKVHHAGNATRDSGHGGDGINTGYGIYMITSDNTLQGNEFYSNNANAIVAYGDRHTIRNNSIHDNGLRGGTNYGVSLGSSAYPRNSDGNVIQGNTVFNNRGGILVYTNATNTTVTANTVYSNKFEGIMVQYATGTVVSDNTVYGNGTDYVDLGTKTTLRKPAATGRR
jgi:parallel beta-helix repeat protein